MSAFDELSMLDATATGSANTDAQRQAVTRTVTALARDESDKALLLDMLGLLPSAPEGPTEPEASHAERTAEQVKNAAGRRRGREKSRRDPRRADRAGHGKANTYKNHACRCEPCKAAMRAEAAARYARQQAAKTAKQYGEPVPGPWRHGSRTTYRTHGCRCEPCTKANSAYASEWRERRAREAVAP